MLPANIKYKKMHLWLDIKNISRDIAVHQLLSSHKTPQVLIISQTSLKNCHSIVYKNLSPGVPIPLYLLSLTQTSILNTPMLTTLQGNHLEIEVVQGGGYFSFSLVSFC